MTLTDDLIYVSILVSSVAVGFLLRVLREPWQKQLISALLGLVTVVALCGYETFYSFTAICGTVCIILSHNKQTPLLAFIFVFSFLLLFRCSTFFGLPPASPVGNAVQLLLTLKLISVAIEIHDYRHRKKQSENTESSTAPVKFQLQLEEEPNIFDIFCYSYCYVGMFTGPFFKFRTYRDYLNRSPEDTEKIPWKEELIHRGRQIGLYAPLFLIASLFFSVDHVKSDEFYDYGFWYRLLYMVPIFFLGRMRFYTAWLAAECSFVTSTLGAYPKSSNPKSGHGPTVDPKASQDADSDDIEYSFEAVRNINPEGSEWSCTVRDGMRNWNMSVQWWLANYVHKRWPANLKQFRIAAVLGCSAYWHGIAPGFFGAFLTMPFVMAAEDMLGKIIKRKLPENMHAQYDWVNWFFKMRSFEYMYMAFALLSWHDTYRWWKSVHFIGHVLCFGIILGCTMYGKLFKTKKEEHTKKE